jgi:hypothetical protein
VIGVREDSVKKLLGVAEATASTESWAAGSTNQARDRRRQRGSCSHEDFLHDVVIWAVIAVLPDIQANVGQQADATTTRTGEAMSATIGGPSGRRCRSKGNQQRGAVAPTKPKPGSSPPFRRCRRLTHPDERRQACVFVSGARSGDRYHRYLSQIMSRRSNAGAALGRRPSSAQHRARTLRAHQLRRKPEDAAVLAGASLARLVSERTV